MKNLKELPRTELIAIVRDFARKQQDTKIRDLVLQALEYAIEIHEKQKYRPDGPYINHVLRVAVFLIELGITNPFIVVVALLHNSVEDQADKILSDIPPTMLGPNKQEDAFSVLERIFGSVIVVFIRSVTNPDWSDIAEKSERNKLYIEHVKEILWKVPEAAMVKLADFYDNGLTLAAITDPEHRRKLCKKYLPVFNVFIETVPRFAIGFLSEDRIAEIVISLRKGWAYVEAELMMV